MSFVDPSMERRTLFFIVFRRQSPALNPNGFAETECDGIIVGFVAIKSGATFRSHAPLRDILCLNRFLNTRVYVMFLVCI